MDDKIKEILKVSISKLCEAESFNSIDSSALDILVELLFRYLKSISTSTTHLTNSCNRTITNIYDAIEILSHKTKLSSYLKDFNISKINQSEFPYYLPPFPIPSRLHYDPSHRPHNPIIPHTLPSFPPPHTHIFTPISELKEDNERAEAMKSRPENLIYSLLTETSEYDSREGLL